MKDNKKRHTLNIDSRRSKYSNCKIFAPSGKLMCVNSEKKGKWYVEKTGAEVLKRNDDGSLAEIKLTFQPKGEGFDPTDKFGLSVQETRCVVSGSRDTTLLTKHHIVPISYRRHFPLEYKSRNHHDVVFITEDKHDEYERKGNLFRDELAKRYGILTERECAKLFSDKMRTPEVQRMKSISSYIMILNSDHVSVIPAARLNLITKDVVKYINKTYSVKIKKISEFWLNKVATDIDAEMKLLEAKFRIDPYKALVETVGNIDKFVKLWRKHFVETMKPPYLPIGWSINYRTKTNL